MHCNEDMSVKMKEGNKSHLRDIARVAMKELQKGLAIKEMRELVRNETSKDVQASEDEDGSLMDLIW